MEKETDKSTVVLKAEENVGVVQIADDVVAMIASLAATEVDGVSAMAGNITNEQSGHEEAEQRRAGGGDGPQRESGSGRHDGIRV